MFKSEDSAHIKNSLEIYNLLKKIQKSRQLITFSNESTHQQYLTALLEVHHNDKKLIFDEPNPQPDTKLIESKNEAHFSLKLDQLPVKFKTTVSLSNSEEKNSELLAAFPQQIYYPQNRKYYRFRTDFIDDIAITIFLSSTKRLACKLVNISLKGICLRFPYSFANLFQINRLIDDIYIKLPEQNEFSISAKVNNLRIVNNHNNIAVGLEILGQKSSIEKIIQQFIFRRENI